jgi:hypothetical protein
MICSYCGETCVPRPDTTLTCSPETCLRVMNPDDEMNAQTALHQDLITIDGGQVRIRLYFALSGSYGLQSVVWMR